MGFLSALGYGQDPYASPYRRLAQAQTPFAPAPQMGPGQGPTFAAPQPGMNAGAGVMAQPPGGAAAQLAQGPQSPWARLTSGLNGLENNSLFNIGLSLLGNSRNGGDWGAVAQDMRAFGADQRERQMLDNEQRRMAAADRRADSAEQRQQTAFGWQQQDFEREQQQLAQLDAWIETLPEDQRAAARANPQAAHAAFVEAQMAAQMPITPFQRAQLDIQRRGLDIDATRVAQSFGRSQYLRGPDRDLMEQVRNASGSANELLAMMQMFGELNAVTGTGGGSQWIPFDSNRAGMRQLSSMMRALMRPVGSGATSDYEQRLYAQGVPRVDLLGPQNQQLIRNAETLARLRNARRYFYEEYADANGTLNGAEQAFQNSEVFANIQAQNPLTPSSQQGDDGGSARPRDYGGRLPDPGDFPEGHRLVDDRGRTVVLRNGRWVREAPRAAGAPPSQRPGTF